MSNKSSTTNPVPAPTPADLARDLAADLRAIEPFRVPEWSPNTLADAAIAAIRRALHAEAECERLRGALRRVADLLDEAPVQCGCVDAAVIAASDAILGAPYG